MKLADRIKLVVNTAAAELYAKKDMGPMQGAFKFGVVSLRDELDKLFSFADYEPEPLDVLTAAKGWCHGSCPHGTEAEPGEHESCKVCPLKQFTIDDMPRNVARAMGRDE